MWPPPAAQHHTGTVAGIVFEADSPIWSLQMANVTPA
jgi:hypothetical protein